jgi:hypothetical protein
MVLYIKIQKQGGPKGGGLEGNGIKGPPRTSVIIILFEKHFIKLFPPGLFLGLEPVLQGVGTDIMSATQLS